ncbi:helix-turn-helix domain-containing protein [Candidatus Halocynthiibacter alkanivorans]|uniref:helix-turn-helix domain-containing protein n=1 Tax=Candidatus Halocynthiibacter alkanivorans TaxID=2267619 RepID=UPI000DF258BB|nr:helix-turn-helix domain-containing protein [Candidatus Halocynthiibacter alkanivorans]
MSINTNGVQDPTRYMRAAAAALYLGLSTSKLAKLRMKNQRRDGPPFAKVCGSVIYRKSDLDAWLETNLVRDE